VSRLTKLIEGLQIIDSAISKNKDYDFQHDIMRVGNVDGYTDEEIAKLDEVGFYIDEEHECFFTLS